MKLKTFFCIFLLINATLAEGSCTKKEILSYSNGNQNIKIYHCGFSGVNYLKLVIKDGAYEIFCELNKSMHLFIQTKFTNDVYGPRYYAISDTVNRKCIGGNKLIYKISDESIKETKTVPSLFLVLLRQAINLLSTKNAQEYNIDLNKVLFFVRAEGVCSECK